MLCASIPNPVWYGAGKRMASPQAQVLRTAL